MAEDVMKLEVFENLPKQVTPYRKELKQMLGSVKAAILMQQLEYRFGGAKKRGHNKFYKLLSPPEGECLGYVKGDSWTEELGFSEGEFRTAFSKLGVTYKTKKAFNEVEEPFQGKMYCSYTNKILRQTFYFRNEEVIKANLQKLEKPIPRDEEKEDLQIENTDLAKSKNQRPNITENTTENTQENNSGDSFPETSSGEKSEKEKNKKKNTEKKTKGKADKGGLVRRISSPEELDVLGVYKKYVYNKCSESTPTIIEGIPRAIGIFKEYFHGNAIEELKKSLIALSGTDWFMEQSREIPYIPAPKTVFSAGFINNHLLPLSTNENSYGNSSNQRPKTEAELREEQETRERNIKEALRETNTET